jgi:hypothetical protein
MLQVRRSPVRVPDDVDFFNLPNASSRTMTLRSTQPLTEISIRYLPVGKKPAAHRADNLAPSVSRMSENVGASTSRKPKGLHGLYRANFTYYIHSILTGYLQSILVFSYKNAIKYETQIDAST